MSTESYIIDGTRSPIGTKNGQMVGVRSDDLTAQVIQGLMKRNENVPPEAVEDVVVGCAFPEGPQGMLMARSISVLAELPIESGAKIVNRFCGSSMDSVHQLSQAILAGDIDAGIAGGVEDMFGVPMGGFNPSFNPELYEKIVQKDIYKYIMTASTTKGSSYDIAVVMYHMFKDTFVCVSAK